MKWWQFLALVYVVFSPLIAVTIYALWVLYSPEKRR